MVEKAILFDATRCTACRGCQAACKQWNELKGETTTFTGTYENPPDLAAETWVKIKFIEKAEDGTFSWLFNRRSCMHCTEAACVDVCPSGALFHNEYGFISQDREKCIGCGYCMEFCPFNVPRLDVERFSGAGKMNKCTLCTRAGFNRISAGLEPACVKTCPTDALIFGDRDELLAEGQRRVANLKTPHSQAYPKANLYGEKELGGLHVLYVLADSPEVYGLPADPRLPVVNRVRDILNPLRWVAWGGMAAVLLVNLIVARARQNQGREE